MARTLRTCVLLAMVWGLASCRRTDIRTVQIMVPDMKTPVGQERVISAVRNVPGVQTQSVGVDLDNAVVVVSYESLLLSKKNIEFAIAKAGFRVIEIVSKPSGVMFTNEIPADAEAQKNLPAECRPGGDQGQFITVVTNAAPNP